MISRANIGNSRPYLIVNSTSGGYSRRREDKIVRCLAEAGVLPLICKIKTREEAHSFCEHLKKTDQTPFIIVAAGDGTINAALNGIGPGDAVFALIPLGTSNVLAKELGIYSIKESIRRIVRGLSKPLAVGLLEQDNIRRYFSLMAGVGFDGAVVRDVRHFEKRFLKQYAYVLSALRQIWAWDREQIAVSTDEKIITCHSVIISNAAHYGGKFVVAPGQDVSKPELTVVCITSDQRRSYLRMAINLLLKRDWPDCTINCFTTHALSVNGTKPIQVDGDFAGCGPARLSVVDDYARIIV